MRVVLLPLLALTFACACPQEQQPASVPEATPPTPPPPAPAPVDRLRGFVALDGEQIGFTPCGAETPSKVVGSAVVDLRQTLAEMGVSAGVPPINVEVIGATRSDLEGGGMVSIEALQAAMPPGSTSLCELDASYLYKASGTEPFWGLTVLDGSLRFEAMELEAPVEVAAESARLPGSSGPGWRGEQDGHQLELQLRPERCGDGMSDALYPFSASVTIDGHTFTGCALQGWTVGE